MTATTPDRCLVVLGTGGTISGRAVHRQDNVAYRAGEVAVADLLGAVPLPAACHVETEQVAQVDSKDVGPELWQRLAQRAALHLDRPQVAGVVVAHGTDTLEETAWLLHRVLAPAKPLVLTAAMRPTTALLNDGPQNLADALAVAAHPGAGGVLAVVAGQVMSAAGLRKVQGYRLDAFEPGDGGRLAAVEEGQVRQFAPWPTQPKDLALGLQRLDPAPARWPHVAWLTSHAGFDPRLVDAAVDAGCAGLVVAGTGNGSVHEALLQALRRAEARGVVVWLTSRCGSGRIVGKPVLGPAVPLGPAQARVELTLALLGRLQRDSAHAPGGTEAAPARGPEGRGC